jgi:putative hydrolase of the HAD superfamily
MNLKAVLFDLGDTLLHLDDNKNVNDIFMLGHQAMRDYLVGEGIDVGLKEIMKVSNGIYDVYIPFSVKSFIELKQPLIYSAILYQLGIADYANEELIAGAINSFHGPLVENYQIYEEVKGVLSELKNRKLKLGLISNNYSTTYFFRLLQKFDLNKYFNAKVVSSEIGIRKPHKDIFFQCLKMLNVTSENSMFVGDLLRKDIQGAKNAGMKSVWINRTNETITAERPKPDYEIHNLTELLEILL